MWRGRWWRTGRLGAWTDGLAAFFEARTFARESRASLSETEAKRPSSPWGSRGTPRAGRPRVTADIAGSSPGGGKMEPGRSALRPEQAGEGKGAAKRRLLPAGARMKRK